MPTGRPSGRRWTFPTSDRDNRGPPCSHVPCGGVADHAEVLAGHRHTDSTLTYIHLSDRDLADKLSRGMEQIHGRRVQMLARLGGQATGTATL